MRPVTRGGRGVPPNGYPYNIDLTSMANLQVSLTGYTTNYKSAAVKTVCGANPNLWVQLNDVWLTVTKVKAKDTKKRPANYDDLDAALPTIVKAITRGYQKAGNQLITNMGRMCAYCEKPNPSPTPVEHMVPKDNFPLFSLAWGNFLLSCTVCNSPGTGKGADPERATVRGWPPPVTNAVELVYYNRCLQWYLWPDQSLAYRGLQPRLEYFSVSAAAWRPVPDAAAVRAGIAITGADYPTRTITANIYQNAGSTHLRSRSVRVAYNATTPEANHSMQHFGLDQPGGGNHANPAISDGRMYERTQAWFNIVGQLQLAHVIPPANFDQWWTTVMLTAATTGQFSVWVKVLQAMNIPDPIIPAQTLLQRFLTDCTAGAVPPFPGTDTSQVP